MKKYLFPLMLFFKQELPAPDIIFINTLPENKARPLLKQYGDDHRYQLTHFRKEQLS